MRPDACRIIHCCLNNSFRFVWPSGKHAATGLNAGDAMLQTRKCSDITCGAPPQLLLVLLHPLSACCSGGTRWTGPSTALPPKQWSAHQSAEAGINACQTRPAVLDQIRFRLGIETCCTFVCAYCVPPGEGSAQVTTWGLADCVTLIFDLPCQSEVTPSSLIASCHAGCKCSEPPP